MYRRAAGAQRRPPADACLHLDADWPVAIDDDSATWRSFRNEAWPALYFLDVQGRGQIAGARLHPFVRQQDAAADRMFEIRFDKPGARAWVFTFGWGPGEGTCLARERARH